MVLADPLVGVRARCRLCASGVHPAGEQPGHDAVPGPAGDGLAEVTHG